MALTRDIRIKVSPLQFEIIRNKAELNGFKTLSSFIRESALKEFDKTDLLLDKIYQELCKRNKN